MTSAPPLPPPPLFLDQTEAQIVLGDQPPLPPLFKGLDDRAPRFSQGLDLALMTVVGR